MRKTLVVFIVVLVLIFSLTAQVQDDPVDLVVLLDISAAMSDYYEETSSYLVGPFLQEFLRIGDTFHLIAFSAAPRVEISRRIEELGDVETIIGRILMMYPLDPESDIPKALSFVEQYITTLPWNRSRKIVLISNGAGRSQAVQTAISNSTARLSRRGVDLQYVGIPLPSSGRPASQVSQQTPPQISSQTQTPNAQTPSQAATAPSQQTQTPSQQSGVRGFAIALPFRFIITLIILIFFVLGLIIFFISRRLHMSPNRVMAKAAAARKSQERVRVPQENVSNNTTRSEREPSSLRSAPPASASVALSGYIQKQKTAEVPPPVYPPSKPKPLPQDKPETNFNFDDGPPLLSLFVEDQNTAIGKRNIHLVKVGQRYTIGGGKSDFLIFLVPIPYRIAELLFDGRQCTLYIIKSQYFPDLDSDKVPNCIGKTIRVISDKHYELHFRIERYEDPLKALNKLLNSISVSNS